MKKVLVITAAVCFLVGVLAGMSLNLYRSSTVHASKVASFTVVEHAITDTVGEVYPGGKNGDYMGNQLAFHNPVYNASDTKQVGHDNGDCVRTVVSTNKQHPNGVWECFWTVFLNAGQITVEGPYYDNGNDSMLAITGGTGAYQEIQGQMRLHATGNPVGSEYDFIYMPAN
ncbi:MAG TPA: allene oxide cyclase family protein [Ktedonobacteraceae bacterium]|nr:allene oxide cyclase family protein [Ktedonobacteraceae bacterium]